MADEVVKDGTTAYIVLWGGNPGDYHYGDVIRAHGPDSARKQYAKESGIKDTVTLVAVPTRNWSEDTFGYQAQEPVFGKIRDSVVTDPVSDPAQTTIEDALADDGA